MYLIIECSELGDQWECDANREPVCLTDNISQYGLGYEVYQVNPDNTFTLIKEYDSALESGMALYQWDEGTQDDADPVVLEKWKGKDRDSINRTQIKKIKAKAHFSGTVEEIMNDIRCAGSYGETICGKWVVLGEYADDRYSLGY